MATLHPCLHHLLAHHNADEIECGNSSLSAHDERSALSWRSDAANAPQCRAPFARQESEPTLVMLKIMLIAHLWRRPRPAPAANKACGRCFGSCSDSGAKVTRSRSAAPASLRLIQRQLLHSQSQRAARGRQRHEIYRAVLGGCQDYRGQHCWSRGHCAACHDAAASGVAALRLRTSR